MAAVAPGAWVREGAVYKRRNRADRSPGGGGVNQVGPVGVSDRPTGTGYVRYEDLFTSGNTFQQVLNKVTGGAVLTLPEGTFSFSDFANGFYEGVRVPASCGGIWGSGLNTVIEMVAGTSTKASDSTAVPADGSGGTNQCYLLGVWSSNTLLRNFQLVGTSQPHPYNGIRLAGTSAAPLTGITLQYLLTAGAAPGYANFPPGETFVAGANHVTGLQIIGCEFDGRDPATGTRVCASQIGINNSASAYFQDVYSHHSGYGHGMAFYRVAGIHTVRTRCEYNGGASSGFQHAGVAINQEECSGTVLHESPTLIMDSAHNASGFHVTWNSSAADGYADDPNITLTNVTHDAGRDAAGCLALQIGDTYAGGATPQTSMPTITKGGVTLTPKDSSNTSGASAAANFIRYH